MSLMDVETSPEAILEDEELIEAVEQLVETAAASLYSDIMKDVENVLTKWKNVTETIFPVLVYWRQDETLFWEDLRKIGLSAILFLVGFFLLAPIQRGDGRRRRRGKGGGHPTRLKRWFSLRGSSSFENIELKVMAPTTAGDSSSLIASSSDHLGQKRRHSVSDLSVASQGAAAAAAGLTSSTLCTGRLLTEDEDETEEALFEKTWPSIQLSNYGRLVLPPNCKLVEKPKQDSKLLSSTVSTTTTSSRHRRDKRGKERRDKEGYDDPDHPLTRIRNYYRQFFHLVISLLRYDYVAAGWTLFDWLQKCLRKRQQQHDRQQHHQQNPNEEDDDYEDDESDAGSSRTSGTSKRRFSLNSQASTSTAATTNSTLTFHTPISMTSKRCSRTKDDSIPAAPSAQTSNKTATTNSGANNALGTSGAGEDVEKYDELPSSNDTAETDVSSSRLSPLTVEVTATSSILSNGSSHDGEEAEEKKESPSDFPPSLDTSFESVASSSSYLPALTPQSSVPIIARQQQQQQASNVHIDVGEHDVGERIAARLAAHQRSSKKARDALEPYRQNPLRLSGTPAPPATLPRSPPRRSMLNQQHLQEDTLGDYNSEDPTSLAYEDGDPRGRHTRADTYYFETINSQESLRKLTVEVPVPDRNGYILGDDFLPDNTYTPLLVFVNSRSGPQQGHLLITQLRRLLNPIQVWDLADGGPETILESFNSLTRLRILVCGGDGTVSWIVSTIEKMKLQRWPPIAILPLGTGNDLARIHGWGGGYNNESLIGILEQVAESYISWLDRWEMTVENKKGKIKSVKSFFNYLGVGADAQAALQVHMLRESQPQLFFSRVVNKAWYGIFGAEDIIKATSVNLPHDITLIADGVEVPLPADSQGIILLNIDSYAGGVPLWSLGSKDERDGNIHNGRAFGNKRDGFRRSRSLDELRKNHGRSYSLDRVDSVEDIASLALTDEEMYRRVTACDRPSSCQDGLLDIVSIRGAFHLGQIRVGLSNAQLLCQCREVTIHIKRKVSVQTDGEPWRQNTCTLRVRRKPDAAIMLHRSADDSNGVETEMAKLLDWAEEKTLINGQVHAVLMKEFSRRIESKTRQRRVRSQDANIMFSLKRAMGSTGNFQSGHSSTGNIMF